MQKGGLIPLGVLTSLWPKVAGKPIASHSRPVSFEGGTLTLVTHCPSWAAQLRQMAEELRAKINSFLGARVVKTLRIEHLPELETPDRRMQYSKLESRGRGELPGAPFDFRSGLDSEIAPIVERSFAKYFARDARRKPG